MGIFSRYFVRSHTAMSRLAVTLLVLCAGAASAAAPGKLDNWFLEWTVPYTTPVEYQGFKMAWSDNITHMLTDPDVTWDVKTTTDIGKYVSSGTAMGMDLSGEGTIF